MPGDEALSSGWIVYVLRCGDDTLYTGITNDLAQRLALHAQGRGARYTRGRGPLLLVYREDVPTKGAALQRELRIKALGRRAKLALIAGGSDRSRRS